MTAEDYQEIMKPILQTRRDESAALRTGIHDLLMDMIDCRGVEVAPAAIMCKLNAVVVKADKIFMDGMT